MYLYLPVLDGRNLVHPQQQKTQDGGGDIFYNRARVGFKNTFNRYKTNQTLILTLILILILIIAFCGGVTAA